MPTTDPKVPGEGPMGMVDGGVATMTEEEARKRIDERDADEFTDEYLDDLGDDFDEIDDDDHL